MSLQPAIDYLHNSSTRYAQHTHPEGNNINMWLGFKHIMYAAEVALLEHLRRAGLGMRQLFEAHGLVAEIVQCEGRILHALKIDEEISTEVGLAPERRRTAGCLDFAVTHWVERGGRPLKAYSGHLRVRLRRDTSLGFAPVDRHDPELAPFVTDAAVDPAAPRVRPTPAGAPRHSFELRVPYYYCHGNERMKMSAYLRLMEQADAEFCAARGIPIVRLLDEQRWIPAVPCASVSIVGEARMDETLRVSYEVVDVVKSFTYRSAMHCHVKRGEAWVPVASGEIVHAYAEIHDRSAWGMVTFDERVMAAVAA
jgi:acyl-CoA thioesterase FadM